MGVFYEKIQVEFRPVCFYNKDNTKCPEKCITGQRIQEELMSQKYDGMAVGVFELDSECACFVALDAAAKAAAVQIQGVERNRLSAGACVKLRGSVSDVKAAMEAALDAAGPISKIVSHTVIASPSKDTETALEMTIRR